MTKPKKPPKDMTTEELAKAVFHPKVLKKLKEIVAENDYPPKPNKYASSI